MNNTLKCCVIIVSLLSLAACSSKAVKHDFSTVAPQVQAPPIPSNGSIYQNGFDIRLFEDQKARRVGDIITVTLAERMDASKSASTSTTKDDDVNIANPTLFGSLLDFPGRLRQQGWDFTLENRLLAEREFSGEGDSEQSNALTGSITVTVVEVMANGNLRIRGEKMLNINQGEEFVRFSGIIRPVDISPDNTVLSTQVADAKIIYTGEGAIANANSQGWLSRFFSGKWWPF